MNTLRTTATALKALRRNPMRALLTTLGIVIGVGAVIAMMEIGSGSSAALQDAISSMGANVLMIQPGTASSGGISFGAGSVTTLTPGDAEALAKQCPALRGVAPEVRARTQVVYGNRNWVPSWMTGTTPVYLEVANWSMAEGDFFTERDVLAANKVCVLGQTVVRELFQGESPIGKEIRVKNVSFRVVGVLASKGANMMGMDQDDILLAPWTTLKYRVTGSTLTTANQSAAASTAGGADTSGAINTLSKIYPGQASLYPERSAAQLADNPMPVRFENIDRMMAAAKDAASVPAAIDQITSVLRERHRIRPGDPADFNIRDMTEMTKTLASTSNLMTNLLLSVAMISLLVGGVGIMNIMLVSVHERTREIGLRRALGARKRTILVQFLIESSAVAAVGGAIGTGLGLAVAQFVALVSPLAAAVTPSAVLLGLGFSAVVGLLFGSWPAWRAANLDPVEALRWE